MAADNYDLSPEFPGLGSESDVADCNDATVVPKRNPFRLVVLQSPVVTSKRNIASISEYSEVSIGRDIPFDPDAARLRLKEMAVSKYHAIIFWDPEQKAWGLVDVGSVHGTFAQSSGSSTPQRLSPAKVASHPRFLRHLDVIQIGGSTMVCHIHTWETPKCEHCIPTASNALSLMHKRKTDRPSAPLVETADASASYTIGAPQDARTSLSRLKTHLLRHNYRRDTDMGASPTAYVDRAASRRIHLGTSTPPVDHPPPEELTLRSSRTRATYGRAIQPILNPMNPPSQVDTTPHQPEIPSSNIGHRLLSMQGWKQGTGLGVDLAGIKEPVFIKRMADRAGLGSGVEEERR